LFLQHHVDLVTDPTSIASAAKAVVSGAKLAAAAKQGLATVVGLQPEYGPFWNSFESKTRSHGADVSLSLISGWRLDPEFIGAACRLMRGDRRGLNALRVYWFERAAIERPQGSGLSPDGVIDALTVWAREAAAESMKNFPTLADLAHTLMLEGLITAEADRVITAVAHTRRTHPSDAGEASKRAGSSAVPGLLWDRVGAVELSEFGVTLADPAHGFRNEYGPRIRRDLDAELRSALDDALKAQSPTYLLLVGPSGSGKTRAARDVLLENCPEAELVIPDDAASIGHAFDSGILSQEFPSLGRVVFLDDLELFVAANGVTEKRLRSLRRVERPIVVIATAGGKGPGLLDPDDRGPRGLHLAGVRPLFTEFRLRPFLSDTELATAPLMPDTKLRVAAHGLHWLTGSQRLREKLESGQHSRAEPSSDDGQKLVRLVLEWHSSGVATGITEPALRSLMLDLDQSMALDQVDAAMRWALKPVVGSLALIYRSSAADGPLCVADDFVREEAIWYRDEPVDLDRWAFITRSLPPLASLEILEGVYDYPLAQEGTFEAFLSQADGLRAELEQEEPDTGVARLDSLVAGVYEEYVSSFWHRTNEELSDAERSHLEARLAFHWPGYLASVEQAASHGTSTDLFRQAAVACFIDSRAEADVVALGFDLLVAEGGDVWGYVAGAPAFSPLEWLIATGRNCDVHGDHERARTVWQVALRHGDPTADNPERDEKTMECTLATASALLGEWTFLGESNARPDWKVLVQHHLELGDFSAALRIARLASETDGPGLEARCLVALGEDQSALWALGASTLELFGEKQLSHDLAVADILGLLGRYEQQIDVLRTALAFTKPMPPRPPWPPNDSDDDDVAEHRYWALRNRHEALAQRHIDLAFALEANVGIAASEAFLRQQDSRDAHALLDDLLWRTGRARQLPAHTGYLPLWGRIVALDGWSSVVVPWDPRHRRVELPGYREAARRINRRYLLDASNPNTDRVAAELAVEACIDSRWDDATKFCRHVLDVAEPRDPEPGHSPRFLPGRTRPLWSAAQCLDRAGHARPLARDAIQLCRDDGYDWD
jgi:tetratricopeptide (TPR) repeat protein